MLRGGRRRVDSKRKATDDHQRAEAPLKEDRREYFCRDQTRAERDRQKSTTVPVTRNGIGECQENCSHGANRAEWPQCAPFGIR